MSKSTRVLRIVLSGLITILAFAVAGRFLMDGELAHRFWCDTVPRLGAALVAWCVVATVAKAVAP